MNPRSVNNLSHPLAGLSSPARGAAAFTLVEMLISVTILALLMIVLTSFTDATHRAWRQGQSRTEAFQSARTSLEIMSRELTPAVVDTRMQFVIAPATLLTKAGAAKVALNSPVLLWMSPLGNKGELNCVGYYLYRDDERQFYRLKRLIVGPALTNGTPSSYYPKMLNITDPRDPKLRTSPINAAWFTANWDKDAFDEDDPNNDKVIISSAADGVVAFWVQPIDLLGNPIPSLDRDTTHPASDLNFNSAAYFQMATSTPFENGRSFTYLAQTAQTMKANRLPSAVDLTVVTIDNATIDQGFIPPTQTNVYSSHGALDIEASIRDYEARLRDAGIKNARTFTTRATLINGN